MTTELTAAEEKAELESLMTAMAAGDIAVIMRFTELFGSRVAAVVRRHLRDLNRPDLADRQGDVAVLLNEAVLVIYDKAAGWSAQGDSSGCRTSTTALPGRRALPTCRRSSPSNASG